MTRFGAPRRLLAKLALVPDQAERITAAQERLDIICEELIPALSVSLQDLAATMGELKSSIEATNSRLDLVVDESTRRAEASLAQVVTQLQRLDEQAANLSNHRT